MGINVLFCSVVLISVIILLRHHALVPPYLVYFQNAKRAATHNMWRPRRSALSYEIFSMRTVGYLRGTNSSALNCVMVIAHYLYSVKRHCASLQNHAPTAQCGTWGVTSVNWAHKLQPRLKKDCTGVAIVLAAAKGQFSQLIPGGFDSASTLIHAIEWLPCGRQENRRDSQLHRQLQIECTISLICPKHSSILEKSRK